MMRLLINLLLVFTFETIAPSDGAPEPPGPVETSKIWSLLVAGSSSWSNYRHQFIQKNCTNNSDKIIIDLDRYDGWGNIKADVCHAYQLLRNNGIPDENIVVMMMDDIANSTDNPTPGTIINFPGGPDVYEGVPKDYTGKDVTPDNFLNILAGNKTAMKGIGSGKVIESGPKDLVFINFVDHGGVGVLYFPDEELYADELLKTLQFMASKKKFSKLIMYIEACHAGSMFDDLLPETTNVFALTASDPHESSYACYYDDTRQTYLADVFSIVWMNDTEHESLAQGSLHHQFEKVRTYTNTSHVEEYGDLDIGVTKLKDVLGLKMRMTPPRPLLKNRSKPQHPMDTADNTDLPITVLENQRRSTTDEEKRRDLKIKIQNIKKKRELVDKVFDKIIAKTTDNKPKHEAELRTSKYNLKKDNYHCYRRLYETFSNNCFSFVKNPYARTHLPKLVNMCRVSWMTENKAVDSIISTCHEQVSTTKLKNVV